MNKSTVLTLLACLAYIMYVVFDFSGNLLVSLYLSNLIVPIMALNYIVSIKGKERFLYLFFIFYSIGDLLFALVYLLPEKSRVDLYDYFYFAMIICYVLAYICLTVKGLSLLNISKILKNFKIHVIVLIVLSVYIFNILNEVLEDEPVWYFYYTQVMYNILLIPILPVSFLCYLSIGGRKTFYLFLGALLLFSSEVIDTAFFWITKRTILYALANGLCLLAFYFFFAQAKVKVKK